MANIKSQIKRNKQNEKRAERNKAVRTALKTSTKKIRTAVDTGDAEEAQARQRETSRSLDKAVAKGIVHKRTAARRKRRLAKAVELRRRRVAPPSRPVPTLPVDGRTSPRPLDGAVLRAPFGRVRRLVPGIRALRGT